MAVAENWTPYPKATAMEAGVTARLDMVAPPTVMEVELEMEFEDAERVAVPCPELVARP